MQALLSDIGIVFTNTINWASQILTLIVDTPILLLVVVGMSVTGFVLGWVTRLFRTN